MTISAKDVKKLKDMTNAGMMDCKKALEKAQGNIDGALTVLKEQGLADAKKRGDRDTKEGGVYISSLQNGKIAIALIGCETDFVSSNDIFVNASQIIVNKIATSGNDDINAYTENIQEVITKTKENVELKKARFIELKDHCYSSYIHGKNRIGVISVFEVADSIKEKDEFKIFSNNIAIHIAASAPEYVEREDISKKELDEQANIFKKQIADSGKPENIIEIMLKGKVSKYCSEVCLLEQKYVKDDSITIADYIKQTAKALNTDIQVVEFVRYNIGA